MRQLELLAPAKNLACGLAAIDHGADAVYIGAERFGARAAARNSVEDIAELCRYAHQYGVRVYVTTNTIVYDKELDETLSLMHRLREVGVDAFLVQDMGIVKECKALKDFVLHASTQTDNRTAEKVAWLQSQGFRRVVLARELSLQEISDIHSQVPDVELEVFVHGALCVSYSGQCYASQYCLGRSANRGACAQMCRMKYDLIDADGREVVHQRHLLSLKDLCQIDHLEELADAGAVSFKIEGRLKDVDYVKNVVAAYSQRLNELVNRRPEDYRRASWGEVTYSFAPDLKKTFNRGYTNYFLHAYRDDKGVLQKRDPDIASFDTPKALGEYVGKVKTIHRPASHSRSCSIVVSGTTAFSNGDGLCFFSRNHVAGTSDGSRELVGFRVNRAEGNRLYLLRMPEGLREGMALYRNNDEAFTKLMARQTAVRKIPVKMAFNVLHDDGRGGSSIQLCLHAVGESVSVAIPSNVLTGGAGSEDNIKRVLMKLGNTPYKQVGFEDSSDFSWNLPASDVASLRRFGVEVLTDKLQKAFEKLKTVPSPVPSPQPFPRGEFPAQPHLLNIANSVARKFYEEQGVNNLGEAMEVGQPQLYNGTLLMQCRHCIKFSLGYCVKHGGRRPAWKEPLSLRLENGIEFRLEFDCQTCQMNVLSGRGGSQKNAERRM